MSDMYILGGNTGRTPVRVDDPIEWAQWMEAARHGRQVALDDVGAYRVSTVFLGFDHNFGRFFGGDHTPIVEPGRPGAPPALRPRQPTSAAVRAGQGPRVSAAAPAACP